MAVLLAEHRLERCLAAADRVLALDARPARASTARPAGYCEWALRRRPRAGDARGAAVLARRPRAAAGRGQGGAAALALAQDRAPAADRPEPERRTRRRRRRRGAIRGARRRATSGSSSTPGAAPREVLRGLELAIEPGERVALMGRNGAGKSTLLRAAAGLVEPARGSIAAPGGSALLPQSPADLLVRERVADELPGEAGRAALEPSASTWAAESDPRDLSGGERQRLALAIVMAGAADGELPGLICLDEPTRGMDAARKHELCGWLGDSPSAGAAVARRHPRRRVRGAASPSASSCSATAS